MSAPHEIDGELLIHETAKECWNAWLSAAGIADRVAPAGPTLNGDLAIAAAEAGQGLTLADQIQAGDALAAGRLVRPFDVVAKRFGYFFVRPVGAKPSDAATAFEAWLEAELKLFASGFADSTKAKRRPTRTSVKASPASVRSASGTRR
jgi:LysR family glycine cleavage system transcriptional activator